MVTRKTKMCGDLLMFSSLNQRCYLTQVPFVISITVNDTKDNQRLFVIARPL